MELVLIEKRKEISSAQKALESLLYSELTDTLNCTIGFPSGSWNTQVALNDSIWFNSYLLDEDGKTKRFWNGFGVTGEIDQNKSNNITVEINIPVEGINRSVAGAFAFDEEGEIYLLHRGRIGGGRKGIGKDSFLNWTSKGLSEVRTSKGIDSCIVIGRINDSNFIRNLSDFIHDVNRFKSYITSDDFDGISLLSLEEIEDLIESSSDAEESTSNSSLRYSRSSLVKEHARRRANGICQLCELDAPFKDRHGQPFLEVHHIEWLSRGGSDTVKNTVALCPNCHRKLHIIDASTDVDLLYAKACLL